VTGCAGLLGIAKAFFGLRFSYEPDLESSPLDSVIEFSLHVGNKKINTHFVLDGHVGPHYCRIISRAETHIHFF